MRGDDVAIGVPLYRNGGVVGVVVARRRLTEVANAVTEVRRALLAAAGVGLLVAFALAVALASTLLRRLGRLRAAALRISAEGPTVSMPRDAGHDEVGDLARALGGMQEELRRQESARRAFVATASHELRTPLTMLQGTMELLEEDLARRPARPHRRAAPGRDRAARAAAALDPGRGAARPLAPRRRGRACAPRRSSSASWRARWRRSSGCARASARSRSRSCRPSGAVLGPRRPRRGRARRAHPDRQRAALRRRRADPRDRGGGRGTATVEVADRGPGVPAEERERIFERFYRGRAAAPRAASGSASRSAASSPSAWAAALTLADRPGGGTRFVLSLPRSPRRRRRRPPRSPAAVSAGS